MYWRYNGGRRLLIDVDLKKRIRRTNILVVKRKRYSETMYLSSEFEDDLAKSMIQWKGLEYYV